MKKERTTFGDRIAASYLMLLAAFITFLLIWLFITILFYKADNIASIPFAFVIYSSVSFALFAFIAPNKSLDTIGWVWKKIENIIKSV